MRQARIAVVALATAIGVSALPGTARAEVKYWVTQLEVPARAVSAFAYNLSDTGWVNGNFTRADGTGGGFLYHAGTFTELPGSVNNEAGIGDSGETIFTDSAGASWLRAGGMDTNLSALGIAVSRVNGPGLVVGTRNGHPVVFQNGAVTELTAIDGAGEFISAKGHVVGRLTNGGSYLYWNGVTTILKFVDFPWLGDQRRAAVNASGVVYGWYLGDLGEQRLGYWDGSLHDVGYAMPGFPGSDGNLAPHAINARGDIVGDAWAFPSYASLETAFLYTAADGVFHDFLGIGGLQVCAHGMNSWGDVTGHGLLPGQAEGSGPNIIYTGGKLYDLNTLVPAGTHYLASYSGLVNDHGQILVETQDDAGYSQSSILLTPLPVTAAAVSGTRRADGWYTSNATVKLTATSAATSVKEIRYSLDGTTTRVVNGSVATLTVSTNGAHRITFFAVDDSGHPEETKSAYVNVDKGGFIVTTPSPINATQGAVLSLTLTASRGTTPYTWSHVGALPPGLSRSGALIQGTPTTAGSYPVTVTARDRSGRTATSYLTFVVVPPFVITTPSLVTLSQGPAGLHASGGTAPLAWTLSPTTPLPAGIFFHGATLITDGSTPLGEYPVTFTVKDDAGRAVTKTISLGLYQPITISGPNYNGGYFYATVGQPISWSFSATGGHAGGYTWSTVGAPDGYSIDAKTGTLSGVVSTAGYWPMTVWATDALGGAGSFTMYLYVN